MTRRLAMLALLPILLGACTQPLIRPEPSVPPPAEAPASAPVPVSTAVSTPVSTTAPGETLTLAWGETAHHEESGIDLTFESIFSDGRCPLDVVCNESAPVTVNLMLTDAAGRATPLNLSAHTDLQGNVDANAPGAWPTDRYGPVTLTLLSVTPYPQGNGPSAPEEFRVTLHVETADEDTLSTPTADGTPFELTRGEPVDVAGSDLTLRLRRVEDTRCPLELDCDHGGGVDVSLTVLSENAGRGTLRLAASTDVTGRIGDPEAATALYSGYAITLLRVQPYPQSGDDIPQNEYVVTLAVAPTEDVTPTPTPLPGPTPEATATPRATSNSGGAPQPVSPPGSGAVSIPYGETRAFEDGAVFVTFEAVNNDSRCPLDVNCAWSGVVNVQLRAESHGKAPQSFEMGGVSDSAGNILGPLVEATGPTSWWYEGYTIDLKAVRPYPAHANQPSPEQAYSVIVEVHAGAAE